VGSHTGNRQLCQWLNRFIRRRGCGGEDEAAATEDGQIFEYPPDHHPDALFESLREFRLFTWWGR